MKMKDRLLNKIIGFSFWMSDMGTNLFNWAYGRHSDYYSDLFVNPVPFEHLDDVQKVWLLEVHQYDEQRYNQLHELDGVLCSVCGTKKIITEV